MVVSVMTELTMASFLFVDVEESVVVDVVGVREGRRRGGE